MHTDANEIAGVMEEIFGREMTTADRLCQHCHLHHAIGAHVMYRSSGMVVRCPTCGHIAATIVPTPEGHAVSLGGAWMFT